MGRSGKISTGAPSRLRSFDPVRLADLEYRVWVGYYLRQWPWVLIASVGLVRVGFGMGWLTGGGCIARASTGTTLARSRTRNPRRSLSRR
jgi:hypothetical protein